MYEELNINMSKTKKNILVNIEILVNGHKVFMTKGGQFVFDKISDIIINIGEMLALYEDTAEDIFIRLEEYAKIIMHMETFVKNNKNIVQLNEIALQQLESLSNYIEKLLPADKKEVYFLPYKASMWDSLESVWEKYEANEEWEAYVMPIPYYDRNQDFSLGTFHWEGELFPKNVSITDYKNVDLQKVHPEKIYIHNPYDGGNIVTSVALEYYSDKLKALTDELVYIPYFVIDETHITAESIKHFALTYGVINAHKVILQSEKVKQCYVEALVEYFGEKYRDYFDNKILGTGSPKLEKVRKTKKENVEIPEQWLKHIQKPDGSWKKIIMYNNSITALLEHPDKMIEKYRHTLKTFKENRDKVCLLWRPHPLIKATMESMLPQLWEEYSQLVEEYRKADWGIYDDTPDLDRAIVLSDGYYGDSSSVVKLMQEAEKVCMIQNVDVLQ